MAVALLNTGDSEVNKTQSQTLRILHQIEPLNDQDPWLVSRVIHVRVSVWLSLGQES